VTTLKPALPALPALPVVLLLPAVHRSAYHGGVHAGRPRHDAMRAWVGEHGVVVPTAELVAEHVRGGHGNPDGLHWGWAAHEVVGAAVARALPPSGPARS